MSAPDQERAEREPRAWARVWRRLAELDADIGDVNEARLSQINGCAVDIEALEQRVASLEAFRSGFEGAQKGEEGSSTEALSHTAEGPETPANRSSAPRPTSPSSPGSEDERVPGELWTLVGRHGGVSYPYRERPSDNLRMAADSAQSEDAPHTVHRYVLAVPKEPSDEPDELFYDVPPPDVARAAAALREKPEPGAWMVVDGGGDPVAVEIAKDRAVIVLRDYARESWRLVPLYRSTPPALKENPEPDSFDSPEQLKAGAQTEPDGGVVKRIKRALDDAYRAGRLGIGHPWEGTQKLALIVAADCNLLSPPAQRPVEPVERGCGICGGREVYIRGRYPGFDNRKVCPTCLADRIDNARSTLDPQTYQAASALGITPPEEPKP